MPPGPSQQGRFKPRKPAKKIRAGAAAAAAVVPDAAPSSAGTDAPTAATTGRGGRGGRGERGGRGGRSGRGRRAPVIQGRGFFMGVTSSGSSGVDPQTAKQNAKGKKGSKGADDSKGGLVAKRKDESTEEIVGTMDKAIGSNLGEDGGKRSVLEDYNDGDFTGPSKFDDQEDGGYINEDGIFYDSDSSLEESKPRPRNNNIKPLRLPFPNAALPVGVGAKDDNRAPMYLYPKEEEGNNNNMAATTSYDLNKPSPFVDTSNKNALKQETNSFFLFQFPTRLPPLLQQNATSSKKDSSQEEDQVMEEAEPEEVKEEETAPIHSATAEVVTPPTKPGSFDNSMTGATPGKLGKLVVYKSGKTVLVLQGADGSSEIRMNVTEGLTCGFDQHAVLIDPEEGRYVKLGSVYKSAVVTPDLNKAFGI